MKTQREIEQMKIKIENKMQELQTESFKACDDGKVALSKELHKDFTLLVAQYNILCDVLR